MENYDVVKKLIGPITAVGESNEDARRFGNLHKTCDLVDQLLQDIFNASYSKTRVEYSMKKIGERAEKFLKLIADYVPEKETAS